MTVIRYEAGQVAKVLEAVKMLNALQETIIKKGRLEAFRGQIERTRILLSSFGRATLTDPSPKPEVSDLMDALKDSVLRQHGLAAPVDPTRGAQTHGGQRAGISRLEHDIEQLGALVSQVDDADRQELLQYVRGFVSGRRKSYLTGH